MGNTLKIEGVEIKGELGKGSYGVVYKAKWNGRFVAVKVLRDEMYCHPEAVEDFKRECEFLRDLEHPNIVQMHKVLFPENRPPILITELMFCDLHSYYKNSKSSPKVPLDEAIQIMLDVGEGLKFLHDRKDPIVHRDLKSANILLDTKTRAKIADLGQAKQYPGLGFGVHVSATTVPGTTVYMAPETFPDSNYRQTARSSVDYGAEIDVFSFGVVLLEVIVGHLPCPKPVLVPFTRDGFLVPEHTRRKKELVEMGSLHPLRDIVLQCLENDPSRRPTVSEVIRDLRRNDGSQKRIELKIAFLGNSGVGKSLLIKRYIDKDIPQEFVRSTIGVELHPVPLEIGNQMVILRIVDPACQERFDSIAPALFRGSHGAFLVYDISQPRTFTDLPKHKNFIDVACGENVQVMLIGNKTDLIRRVSFERAQSYAKLNGMEYAEVSAMTLENVEEMFERLASNILDSLHTSDVRILEKTTPVPPEILARGPLALRAYNNALKEGRTCVRRMPVMFIGPERSGKTSLKKSLKGQPFKLGEESTVGIDADPSHFKVSTEIWKAGEKDKKTSAEAISYEHLTAQLIAGSLMEEKQTSEKRATLPLQSERFRLETVGWSSVLSHSFTSRENQEPNEKDLEPVHSGRSLSTGGDSPESSRGLALTSNASHYDSKPPDVPNVSYYDSKPDDVLKAQKTDDMLDPGEFDQQDASNVPEEIATLLERLLHKVKKVEEEEDIYSVLWDFGGQSVYYVTHPLFLTPRAIYLLAYDLSRNPHDKADPLTKQGMFKKLQDNFRMKTNLDFLDFWMTSVASLTSQREDQPVCSNRSLLLPPVFLVCTHADEPHGGVDPRTLANEIFDFLQNQPYSAHLFEHVFVVDNSKSGGDSECPEVLRLRREVLAVAKKLPQMEEEIPIKWLQYERALQVMKEEGHPWISLERAKEIASEVCKFDNDQEILTLLNFLHDQRILIHFDNTPELNKFVVLDPQWLIDVFKKVITVKPYDQEEKEFKYLWRKLEKTGILEEKLLEHAWEALLDKDETFESLIAIMEKFSLMCLWPSPNTSCTKQYLVPSMLTAHPPQGIMKLLESAQFPSLFLKFESRQIPPNLFPRLVLQLFQWWTDEFPRHASPQLRHNFARFYVSPDVGCSVVLLCHPSSSVEVVLLSEREDADLSKDLQSKMGPSVDEGRGTFEATVARAVRRQLLLLLECMQKEFCWLNNIRCKVSFLCPTCSQGGRVNFCQAHLAEGCKQQECLHFWSESELYNCPQGVFCRKSADAVEFRVQLKQFAPWFVPLNEKQETTVEDDGGFLPFVEVNGEETGEKRALALSCAAQDVFPLQSCDPKDIQVRLQQDSQLEHAFLENSDTAIKRMESGEERALALPCAVKEAILSQTCDAKDVVARLQEDLQLEQASIENPERETKRMIRSLARTAKYSNRLDVVRHLRDITPAGTTGPLLHENLDVQNLPLQQSRDLSVHLSGGDEWTMVAERLGLRPAEIRFLDRRSRNPFEAALVHSRNQRYLNVGQLYDVLVDCGYPIYADFL